MTSLLTLLRTRYLEALRSVKARWKIVVLDEYTAKLLAPLLDNYQILEEGVQQIDIITAQRSPQSHLPAIYLLSPTAQNVQLILNDFQGSPPPQSPAMSSSSGGKLGRKSKDVAVQQQQGQVREPPKYQSAHLHFIEAIDDELVNRLTSELPDTYLQSLTELYVNFHALEARTFSLKNPRAFFSLYAPPDRSPQESVRNWEGEIERMSRSLVNSLVTLGEYPLIRYYSPPTGFHKPLGPAVTTGMHICEALAKRVQRDIDEHARMDQDFPPTPDPPRPRGVLFITDRSMDIYAPLLHEFTYQAMVNDLLDIEDGSIYRYTFRNATGELEDKETILSEEDKVWIEVRHQHMKDTLEKLIEDFKAYAGEHGARTTGTSLNDMKDLLASLPQLKDSKEKMSLHLSMADECMRLFEKQKLPLSASVEQCCATGVTPEGKTPKTLVEEMVPLLDDRSVSATDKVRIIAMYIMYRDGVPEGDKKRLYEHARLAMYERDAIDNLAYLGVNVGKDSGKKRKALFKQIEEDDAYDISRYQPMVKYMLEEHFANRLDQSVFPYVRDAPVTLAKDARNGSTGSVAPTASLRSMRADWATKGRQKVVNEPRQRVIVFVAGGATYSEVRAVYKVSEKTNRDIFLGTTHMITPKAFVSDLSKLDRGGASSGPRMDYVPGKAPSKQSSRAPEPAPPAPQPQPPVDRRYANQQPPPNQAYDRRGPPPSQDRYLQQASSAPPQQYRSSRDQQQQPPPSQQHYQQQQPPHQSRDRARDDPRASYHSQTSQHSYQSSQHSYSSQQPPPRGQYATQSQVPPPQQHQQYAPSSSLSTSHSAPSRTSQKPTTSSSAPPPQQQDSRAPAPEKEKEKKKKFFRF